MNKELYMRINLWGKLKENVSDSHAEIITTESVRIVNIVARYKKFFPL
jgi:hypothetical protein